MTLRYVLALLALLCSAPLAAQQWQGYLGLETSHYPQQALAPVQQDTFNSLLFEPELYHRFEDSDWNINIKPFVRLDDNDDARSHADLRELNLGYERGDWVWRFGLSKVFWGVTESQHLVDIVNQTDALENADSEDKLGQLMIYASAIKDWGTLDLFVLPGFREREFRSEQGRLRPQLPVLESAATYATSKGTQHVDYALRWSHVLGNWDIGLSWFKGTNREPDLLPTLTAAGSVILIPHYRQIEQFGIDLQSTYAGWLWKLEAIYRSSQGQHFNAWTGGFEYTFYGLNESDWDLGFLTEYSHDSRGETEAVLNDDVLFGFRLTPNDAVSTEFLAGVIIDANGGGRLFNLEYSRRIKNNWKIGLEARLFQHLRNTETLYSFRNDDHVLVGLSYYF